MYKKGFETRAVCGERSSRSARDNYTRARITCSVMTGAGFFFFEKNYYFCPGYFGNKLMVFFARCVYKRVVRKPPSTQTRRTLFVDTTDRERGLVSGGRTLPVSGSFFKERKPRTAPVTRLRQEYQQKPAELSAKNVRWPGGDNKTVSDRRVWIKLTSYIRFIVANGARTVSVARSRCRENGSARHKTILRYFYF